MFRSRTLLSLAALSAYTLSASAVPLACANTSFQDYTGADPLFKKFTLNADGDTTENTGGPGTNADGTVLAKPDAGVASATQQQAQNADGGAPQAGANTDENANAGSNIDGNDTGQVQTQQV